MILSNCIRLSFYALRPPPFPFAGLSRRETERAAGSLTMLVRSAGRRQQRKQTSQLLAASFAQLNLPWLAPAQLRWAASHTTASQRQHQSHRTGGVDKLKQVRRLATAADGHNDPFSNSQVLPLGFRNSLQDEHIPWDVAAAGEHSSVPRPYMEPVIINTTTQNAEDLITIQNGVNGTVSELLQHFHTSLQVGRVERAEVIVQRLAEQCSPNSPAILYAHGAYLEEALSRLSTYGARTVQAQDALREMQKWFELEVRNKGVTPSAKMLVSLIRAITRALPSPNQEILIRRYTAMAEAVGSELHEEVLNSEDYDDHEYTVVGRATSKLWTPMTEDKTDLDGQAEVEPRQLNQPTPDSLAQSSEQAQVESVPEVLPTEQKGSGLWRVKAAMTALKQQAPLPATATEEERQNHAYERQRIMEETSAEIAVERWREADDELRKIGIHTVMQKKPIAALMWQWYQALLPALKQELAEIKVVLATPSRNTDDRHVYGPHFELMSMEKLAAATILHMIATVCREKSIRSDKYESESKLGSLAISMGKSIEEECRAESSILRSQDNTNKQRKKQNSLRKSKRKANATSELTQSELMSQEWPMDLRVKLGAMLVSKLIDAAQLPVTRTHPRTREEITRMQPAFMHRYRWVNGKRIGAITPNPALTDKLESEPLGSVLAKRMPMLVEPLPWKGWNKGGYLHYAAPILRLPSGDNSGRDYFHAADKNGDLDRVYAGLNALSKVPWKVHPGVLKVQIEAWNTGEEIANFPALGAKLSPPPEPEASAGVSARMRWASQMRDLENQRSGLHSKRCFQNFQLEIARSVKDEVLYLPHNMDFRGRAYPLPPYLNHMGADNVRGLLVFAHGKPLGSDGLRWLKIHLATAAGHDKASLEDRVAFTMAHLDDIYDSVRNPLGGRRWWLESEDAWQTLAACFELTEALDSPDPTQFVSHLPIQQDGTCNGLQHYAALGGDAIGARQVNLEPGDKPADVYMAVADAVQEEVRKDAAKGDAIAMKLDGLVTRKWVKQPVMTNVYGVTFYGARAQVEKQLATFFPEVRTSDAINLTMMSHYITLKIFKSLGSMFRGAQAIQNWLGQCAHRISTCLTPEQIQQVMSLDPSPTTDLPAQPLRTATTNKHRGRTTALTAKAKNSDLKTLFKSTVVWTTPLRLPVVQPYRQASSRRIDTTIQGITIQEPQLWDPVSKRKQLQGFPPNFIHSLDATHMLLSAAKCTETGMTFASIHDSFWTHACDVDSMSNVLRDAFVEMHSENIIERLREEFRLRYKDCMYLATVHVRKGAVRAAIKSNRHYKFLGKNAPSELGREVARLRLLNSDDPEEQKKGREMVTPASIIAQARKDGDIESDTSGDAPLRAGLGGMPSTVSHKVDADASNADLDFADADSDIDAVVDTDATDEEPSLDESESEGAESPPMPEKRSQHTKLSIWLPVTFPEIPERGTFDVTRLRASKYFFH
nr:dna-directed rna polymerase, mitochondrial [Quercus suber]